MRKKKQYKSVKEPVWEFLAILNLFFFLFEQGNMKSNLVLAFKLKMHYFMTFYWGSEGTRFIREIVCEFTQESRKCKELSSTAWSL